MIGSRVICLTSLSPSPRSWVKRQGVTVAYQPQVNGSAERMVQPITRALKFMYMIWINESGMNTPNGSPSRSIQQEIVSEANPLLYDVHFGSGGPGGEHPQARSRSKKMAYRMQKYYQQARAQVNQRLRKTIADQVDTHNNLVRPHPVRSGSRVWLYLDRVREGYAKKLAHLWHVHLASLKRSANLQSTYNIFPVVHISKVKLVKIFPDRPVARLDESEGDREDFD
ncbi:LOW QUALITY PROTEIN: hypothetical protein PHMEG_0006853 [Phytophthora megakarya]|uniref:Reverse transcriptase n=1 Tax=Phytophthora megakarya TaxID=4795 RepID=A0A225WMU1_9STRA|nr:LOW QUALITY PROTEIN: hypothetical protein PHMEG_0006853 [Phytophthora megakarya]